MLDCNNRIQHVLGYSRDEAIGMSLAALFCPDHLARAEACLKEVCSQGSSSNHEFRMIRKDGRAIEVSINSAAIRGGSGECFQATCIIEDITERKRAERALREQRNQLRTIFATVPDILVLKDAHFVFRAVNPVFCEFLGRPEQEILGKTDFDLFPAHEAELYRRGDREVLATGRMLTADETVTGRAGARLMNAAKTVVVDGEGRAAGILVSLHDVTDRRRAEKELAEAKHAAEAANRAKSDFLANISHEIRTPMTAILGYTDLLMTSNLTQHESREHLQTVYRNGKALLELINDILDISKIEAGRMTIEKTDCSPREIVDDLVTLMRVRAADKGLDLRAHYAPTLPATIRTDPVRLRQILTNLVGNAIKFTDRGYVQITVSCVQAAGIAADAIRRARHRHRDEPRTGQPALRAVHPGRCLQRTPVRQHRPGADDLEASGREARRRHPGGKLARRRQHFHPVDRSGSRRHRRDRLRPRPGRPSEHASSPPTQVACSRAGAPGRGLGGRPESGLLLSAQGGPRSRSGRERPGRLPKRGRLGGRGATLRSDPDGHSDAGAGRLRGDPPPAPAGWRAPIVALTANAMAGDAARCIEAGCDGHIAKPIDQTEILDLVARYLHPGRLADGLANAREDGAGNRREPLESSLANHPVIGPLLVQFVEELPGRAGRIELAFQNNDVSALAEAAHQLKGAAGIYGFASISDKANVISRQVGENCDLREIRTSVVELIDLCSRASCRKRGPSPGSP